MESGIVIEKDGTQSHENSNNINIKISIRILPIEKLSVRSSQSQGTKGSQQAICILFFFICWAQWQQTWIYVLLSRLLQWKFIDYDFCGGIRPKMEWNVQRDRIHQPAIKKSPCSTSNKWQRSLLGLWVADRPAIFERQIYCRKLSETPQKLSQTLQQSASAVKIRTQLTQISFHPETVLKL